jgi:hypothetical protein
MDFTTLIMLNDLYKSYTEITILRTEGKQEGVELEMKQFLLYKLFLGKQLDLDILHRARRDEITMVWPCKKNWI